MTQKSLVVNALREAKDFIGNGYQPLELVELIDKAIRIAEIEHKMAALLLEIMSSRVTDLQGGHHARANLLLAEHSEAMK